jgi:hypothetical protein
LILRAAAAWSVRSGLCAQGAASARQPARLLAGCSVRKLTSWVLFFFQLIKKQDLMEPYHFCFTFRLFYQQLKGDHLFSIWWNLLY